MDLFNFLDYKKLGKNTQIQENEIQELKNNYKPFIEIFQFFGVYEPFIKCFPVLEQALKIQIQYFSQHLQSIQIELERKQEAQKHEAELKQEKKKTEDLQEKQATIYQKIVDKQDQQITKLMSSQKTMVEKNMESIGDLIKTQQQPQKNQQDNEKSVVNEPQMLNLDKHLQLEKLINEAYYMIITKEYSHDENGKLVTKTPEQLTEDDKKIIASCHKSIGEWRKASKDEQLQSDVVIKETQQKIYHDQYIQKENENKKQEQEKEKEKVKQKQQELSEITQCLESLKSLSQKHKVWLIRDKRSQQNETTYISCKTKVGTLILSHVFNPEEKDKFKKEMNNYVAIIDAHSKP